MVNSLPQQPETAARYDNRGGVGAPGGRALPPTVRLALDMTTEGSASTLARVRPGRIRPAANLSEPRSAQMVWPVRPASDFDRIPSNIAIWHGYDTGAKVELYSTCLLTPGGAYLIDPIPLQSKALDELVSCGGVAGIIVTNSNHHRASAQFAEEFSVPIFAHRETSLDEMPGKRRNIADGNEICEGLRVIGIEGAVAGEIVLHYAPAGGTLIVGDALINFESYGFTFLPGKYCSNEKEMRRSLQKLLNYKAERMLFAHGMPILSGASDHLRGLLGSDLTAWQDRLTEGNEDNKGVHQPN